MILLLFGKSVICFSPSLIHQLPHYCAGLEGQNPPSRNRHRFPRPRLSPFSGSLLAGDEISKAGNLDLLSFFQDLLEYLKYLIHDLSRFLPGKGAFITYE